MGEANVNSLGDNKPLLSQEWASKYSSTRLSDLPLSFRTYNRLQLAGVKTVGDLASWTPAELMDIRHFGRKCLDDLLEVLEDLEGAIAAGASLSRQQSDSPRDVKRKALVDAIVQALSSRPGVPLDVKAIRDAIAHAVKVTAYPDSAVRRGVQQLVDSGSCPVERVGHGRFAWLPDGQEVITPVPETARKMIDMRHAGRTLDEIGQVFGVTRERVRQVLNKHGGPSAAEIRNNRAEREELAERAKAEDVEARLRSVLANGNPVTAEELAAQADVELDDVTRYWPEDLKYLRIWPSTFDKVWSDDAIMVAIREAALYEFPLTAKAYAELLRVGQIQGPSVVRINQRFGSWTAACDLAGVEAGKAWNRTYESRWTDADLIGFVRAYLHDPNFTGAFHRYDDWRSTQSTDAPSGQTLRNRLGSWTEIKQRALAQEDHR